MKQFTVVVQSFNCFGEIEYEKSFRAKTKAAASMQAAKWCSAGWGSEYTLCVHKRTIDESFSLWELR